MIKRKDGRWQEQITLPGMSKPKYFYGKTQAEVRRKMAEWKGEQGKSMLLSEALDRWQEWHETQISPSSVKAYRPPVEDAKAWFEGMRLDEVHADDVDRYLRSLASDGKARATVAIRRDTLSMCYDYAILHRWTDSNPCGPVRLPKGLKHSRREVPSDEELKAVESGERSGMGLLAYLALYTGMRKGELLGLRWEDIDLKAGIINVRRSVYHIGNAPHLKLPKTEAGERQVMILDKLRPALQRKGKGYIFGGVSPLTRSTFEREWRQWQLKTGANITLHQLRHAYCTMLYEAGVSDVDAMEAMGHANISVTRDVYTHIRKQRRESTVRKVNEYLETCQESVKDTKVVDISTKR